jgi:hypothetical protein
LQLKLPRRVRAGERVAIVLIVENRAAHAIDLYLRGRTPTFDIVVTRSDDSVAWRRLEGEVIPAIVRLETLAPAAQLQLVTTWNQRTSKGTPIDTGDYTARGFLLLEGKPMGTSSVPLSIVDR